MIKKILWGVGTVVILFALYVVYVMLTTRNHSPLEVVAFSNGTTEITVEYCRPSKKDRVIFGGLVPYDSYWRTGANEPTIVKFSNDVTLAGELVKAGSYRLYTLPGEKEWTIVLNSELEEWGSFEPDYDLDVLRIKAASESTNGIVEQFTIRLPENEEGADMTLAWDDTIVRIPIKI